MAICGSLWKRGSRRRKLEHGPSRFDYIAKLFKTSCDAITHLIFINHLTQHLFALHLYYLTYSLRIRRCTCINN